MPRIRQGAMKLYVYAPMPALACGLCQLKLSRPPAYGGR